MESLLDLYSELYLVHRASQYKFVANPNLIKSYGSHDIRKYNQLSADYLGRLFKSDQEFDQSVLQDLMKAYLGIEYFQIHSNLDKMPPKSTQGYNLEITITLKFPGLRDLHYIKYNGISKNYNSEVHGQMLRNDPCMVLLKETLPEMYHSILFKLIKWNLINKNKVASVSTSASSHGEGKTLNSNLAFVPPFIPQPEVKAKADDGFLKFQRPLATQLPEP